MATNETNRMLAVAASACEDKKAEDIRILALDPTESGLTDYFLICNGTNDRQNLAIADEVELRLKHEFNNYPNSVEGRRQAEWILLDYVDFIVHVFSAEKRAFYGLERLRKSATTLSVAELNDEIRQQITAGRKKSASAKAKVAKKKPAKTAKTVKAASTAKAAKPTKATPAIKKSAAKSASKAAKSAAKSPARKSLAAGKSATARRAGRSTSGR